MRTTSHSLAETADLAGIFVRGIEDDFSKNNSGKEAQKAQIVTLSGDLGAGKTAFVKAVAKQFGIIEDVTSPTFVIEKVYELVRGPFQHLIHIDAYRLTSGKELLHLGWNELAEDPKNIIFIEWPEKLEDTPEILGADARTLYFEFIDENTREISDEKN